MAAPNGTHANRPGPTLRWTDPRRAPAGAFAALAVPNGELVATAVPQRGEAWETVSAFCLSYDGYAHWDDLPELANRALQRWTRHHTTPPLLDEARACLFYEQRRWHHFGVEPVDRAADYVWALLDTVRALAPAASPAAPPADPRPGRAPETHVHIVAAPDEAPVALRAMPEPTRRLAAVAAAEARIRLVASVEGAAEVTALSPRPATAPAALVEVDDAAGLAAAAARHPSGRRGPVPTGRAAHPSNGATLADLRPMPAAEPLPKPPVIVRRRSPGHGDGAVITALRPSAPEADGAVTDAAETPRPSLALAPAVFSGDDAAYRAWVSAHPQAFVLNAGRTAAGAPVLHQAGCASLQGRAAGPSASAGPKACGATAAELEAWSAAQGLAAPVRCRRCLR